MMNIAMMVFLSVLIEDGWNLCCVALFFVHPHELLLVYLKVHENTSYELMTYAGGSDIIRIYEAKYEGSERKQAIGTPTGREEDHERRTELRHRSGDWPQRPTLTRDGARPHSE